MNAYFQNKIAAKSCKDGLTQTARFTTFTIFLVLYQLGPIATYGQSLGEPMGALLLKNDRVLLGRVERQGDIFLVRIADSSQVSIPKEQAQYLGRDINDLYAYKRQTMVNPNPGDHFKLTRWCMSNNLLDKAVFHYQVVAKDDGTHPKVKQLAVELKSHLLAVPEFRAYLGLPVHENRVGLARSAVPTNVGTSGAENVVTASHPLENPPHPLVVKRFGDRVQPILINRCSQAACHGGQSNNALRLIEPSSRLYAQTSASNLESVLALARADDDDVVPLIAFATQAHGLQRQPGIAVTETQLVAELQTWVELVHNPVVSAVASAPTPGLRPMASGLVPVGRDTEQLKMVPRGDPNVANIPFPQGSAPPTIAELDALERQFNQTQPSNGASLNAPSSSTPPQVTPSRDPFDPTEFNRRVQSQGNR